MKDKDCRFSNRYIALSVRAFKDGKLEAPELASILRTNSDKATEIVDGWLLRDEDELSCRLPNYFVPAGSLANRECPENSTD